MGRRKIEMKVVKDNSCRQVTFSKRRTGLFKKANELATLCGADVAVVVFSPGGKPFSFGQPNVDSIAGRFLNRDRPVQPDCHTTSAAAAAGKLNRQLNDRMKQLQEEKKRTDSLNKEIAKGKRSFFAGAGDSGERAAAPVVEEDLGWSELEKLKGALEVLRKKAKERVTEMEASSTLLMLSGGVLPVSNNNNNILGVDYHESC